MLHHMLNKVIILLVEITVMMQNSMDQDLSTGNELYTPEEAGDKLDDIIKQLREMFGCRHDSFLLLLTVYILLPFGRGCGGGILRKLWGHS